MAVIEGNGSVAQTGASVGRLVPTPTGSRDVPIRELLSDEVLDLLAERFRNEAGQLRLTGEGEAGKRRKLFNENHAKDAPSADAASPRSSSGTSCA